MISIIADTTSGIHPQAAQDMGIGYLPQIIIFGNTSYRDDTEMDTATFLKNLRASSSLPKTAAPPPALYTPIYQKLTTQGHTVIVICPSAELSGTVRSASVAAKDFPDADIRIIDTRTIGSGLASIVIQAALWVKQGLDADVVEKNIRDMSARNRTYFIVDTLEYLYKGGRIGGAQMLVGSLLQVKPILTLVDGKTQPVESQRTKRRAYTRVKELIRAQCPHGPECHITVEHGDAEQDAHNMANELKNELMVTEVPIYELPPAIIVHAGPGVLAISFFVQ